MAPVHIVLTCSKRKRKVPGELVRLSNVRGPTVEHRAAGWIDALQTGSATTVRARDLYLGEQWKLARELQDAGAPGHNLHFWVASAGYGLIPMDARIRPYAATFSPNHPESVVDSVFGLSVKDTVRRWWAALGKWAGPSDAPRSLESLATESPRSYLLVAASPIYLRAIGKDLAGAASRFHHASHLSVFSAGKEGRSAEPWLVSFGGKLRSRFGGSLMSLNLRVLKQVVSDGIPLDTSSIQERLTEWMASTPDVHLHSRRPMTDDEVRRFVAKELARSQDIRWSPLLRKLRDEMGGACEQNRFRQLFYEVTA